MKQAREHWGTRIGLIFATAGSAIGLGSLWRFPYLTGVNGGGFFVLFYIVFTIFIALPLFIAEVLMGRNTQEGPVFAFRDLSKGAGVWKGVGWLSVLTSLLILSYYYVIAGWSLNYTFMSLTQFYSGRTSEEIADVFNLLYISPQMNVLWQGIFAFITGAIVFSGVRKGIELCSKILMPILFAILVALFFYSMFLPGTREAYHFIFYPDPSKLKLSGILEALGMSFFALSVGLGILVTYGSYMRPIDDLPKTAFIIGTLDVVVSLLAAMMIFPIVFTFGFHPQEGAGLIFKALPVLFAKLPGTLIVSTVFFLLVVFTALTSTISLLEVLVANSMDVFQWTRKKAAVLASIVVFIIGIPTALSGSGSLFPSWKAIYGKDFFQTLDYVTGSWCLPIVGLLTAIFVGWRIDKDKRKEEFLKGTKLKFLFHPWLFFIRFIVPIAVVLIILHQSGIINIDAVF